ncbi:site-specific integrase [Hymenobacter jejuensis]|uniref:Site-specific integrase n=1 Tax=Hymenobacter jejuensis TaxID=2502781 RepID=A0A5B8A4W3_9BACT|nr:site-specific integrase [Hymenobacter jejuensis]QDA61625.1 hypothetical protein FHG12_16645 [Hymenobacter jejuensis]
MGNISLTLRNRDKEGRASVYLQYVYQENSKRFATGVKVRPEERYWDAANEKIKSGGSENYKQDNGLLQDMRRRLETLVADFRRDHARLPTLEEATKAFVRGAEPAPIERSFFHCLDEYLALKTSTRAANTLKNFTTLRHALVDFERTISAPITFESWDNVFYERFVGFLVRVKKHQNTTVAKRVSTLREFIAYYRQAGVHANAATFKLTSLKRKVRNATVITLTNAEFEALRALALDERPRLERVRDLFVLQCSTGLRYSDVVRLQPKHVKNRVIRIVTQKTKDETDIPLNAVSAAILAKYQGTMPRISNDKYNEYLKEVCALVPALHREETVVKLSGSRELSVTKPVYQLVGTHTGRRTFITLCLEKGVNPAQIMHWSGHTDLKVFIEYVNKRQGAVEQMSKLFG